MKRTELKRKTPLKRTPTKPIENPVCPYCFSRDMIKHGKYVGFQRWRCQNCKHTNTLPRKRKSRIGQKDIEPLVILRKQGLTYEEIGSKCEPPITRQRVHQLLKRTPLKNKDNGLRRSPLKMVSKKQAVKNALWGRIKSNRIEFLALKYGFVICEYCGKPGIEPIDAHHIDGNRNNNTPENCAILHRFCHSYITDHNIRVLQIG